METYGTVGEGSFCLDPEAGVNTLLNDAAAWLEYARGMTDLLAESMHEDESVDRRRMLLTVGAIGTLVAMGVQCVTQAHAKMAWDKV